MANVKEAILNDSSILHIEKGKTIATENRSLVTRDQEYKEIVTINQQEGVLGVIKLFCIPIVVLVT